jgi:hypothetical protein
LSSLARGANPNWWGLLTIVGLTLGCSRSGLLDYPAAPVTGDADDAATGGEDAPDSGAVGEAGAARDGSSDGSSDAGSSDGSTSASTGDADAAPTQRPDSGCGPDTCHGCCRDHGVCVRDETQTPAFCGSGGLSCIECPPGVACGIDTADGTRVCAHFL